MANIKKDFFEIKTAVANYFASFHNEDKNIVLKRMAQSRWLTKTAISMVGEDRAVFLLQNTLAFVDHKLEKLKETPGVQIEDSARFFPWLYHVMKREADLVKKRPRIELATTRKPLEKRQKLLKAFLDCMASSLVPFYDLARLAVEMAFLHRENLRNFSRRFFPQK